MYLTNKPDDLFIGDKDYYKDLTYIQNTIIKKVINKKPKNIINVSAVGTGKTRITAELIKQTEKRAIIACPKNITKQWGEYFDNAYIYEAGKKPLKLDLDYSAPATHIIIGKEYLAKVLNDNKTKKATIGRFASQFDTLVVDESHRQSGKSMSFKRFKGLNMPYKILLSATPEFNDPINLYRQLTELFQLPINYSWFKGNCVKTKQVVRPMTRADRSRGLHSFVAKSGQSFVIDNVIDGWDEGGKEELLKKAECVIDIKNKKLPYRDIFVGVNLSPLQRKMYDELLDKSFTSARGGHGELLASLPITKRIRLRQICLAEPQLEWVNALKDDVYFDESSKSSKYDAIEKILEQEKGRMIIWSNSRQFSNMLQSKNKRIRAFVGGMSVKQSQEIQKWFIDTTDAVLAIVYTAGSEGLDSFKDVCNTEIIANIADGKLGATQEQASGRLNRTGSPYKYINRYYLIAKDTIESP
jgi:superfamily II DNA or RNA helicase